MNPINCRRCGSNELIKITDQLECSYCQTKYALESETSSPTETVIEVDQDVERLLELCRRGVPNRKRLAELVLDIDPFNEEAIRYLQ